ARPGEVRAAARQQHLPLRRLELLVEVFFGRPASRLLVRGGYLPSGGNSRLRASEGRGHARKICVVARPEPWTARCRRPRPPLLPPGVGRRRSAGRLAQAVPTPDGGAGCRRLPGRRAVGGRRPAG